MVVSGRCRARAKEVKAVAESPRPWRSRRIFGDGDGDDDDDGVIVVCEEEDCEGGGGGGGGGVIVRERWEGKSARVGGFLGMVLSIR